MATGLTHAVYFRAEHQKTFLLCYGNQNCVINLVEPSVRNCTQYKGVTYYQVLYKCEPGESMLLVGKIIFLLHFRIAHATI